MIKQLFNLVRFVFLVSLGVLCLFLLLLSNDIGKKQVVLLLNPFLEKTDYKIKIAEINSFIPFSVRFNKITLVERGDPWLDLTDVTAVLTPVALLQEKFQAVLSAKDVHLIKFPSDDYSSFEIALPFDLDMAMTVDYLLLDQQAVGENLEGYISSAVISYSYSDDILKAKIDTSLLSEAVKDLNIEMQANGHLSDFLVSYKFSSEKVQIKGFDFLKVEGDGQFFNLPSRIEGDLKVVFQQQEHQSNLSTRLSFNEGKLTISSLQLQGDGLDVKGNIEYSEADDLFQGDIIATTDNPYFLSLFYKQAVHGKIVTNGNFNMKGGNLDIDLTMNGKDIEIAHAGAQSFLFRADIRDLLQQPDGKFSVEIKDANTALGDISAFQLVGDFHKGIGKIKSSARGEDVEVDLLLDAEISKTTKKFNIKKLNGQYQDVSVGIGKPFQLLLEKGSLKIFPAELRLLDSIINIEGTLKGDRLDFKAKGDFDLTEISQIFMDPDDIITGRPSFDLVINGTTSVPLLNGHFNLQNGSYENVRYGTVLKDVQLGMVASLNEVVINKGRASDGEHGNLSISGRYLLAKDLLDLKIYAGNLRLVHADQMQLTAKAADFNLCGPLSFPELSGSVVIAEGMYDISKQTNTEIYQLNVSNMPIKRSLPLCESKRDKQKSPFDIRLDVKVNMPSSFNIKGRGLDSIWGGEVSIENTLAAPRMFGSIKLGSGALDFLGQEIILQRGDIVFDGTAENIPKIDTSAKINKSDLKVIIRVLGKVDKPQFIFDSEPPLPQEEILAYILFGKETSKLSPLEAVRLARAIVAYKNPANTGDFLSLMTTNLGLDHFSLGKAEESGDYVLKFTQRLNDNVSVNIDQGLKPEDSKVEIEVKVTDNISAAAEHGLTGSSDAVSVKYNWDY